MNEHLKEQMLHLSGKEFHEKNMGSTEQYLEVMEVEMENGFPKVVNIEENKNNGYTIYFPIKDENFYYTHFFSKDPLELICDTISPANRAYLRVVSDNLSLKEIISRTTIIPTSTWEKGELSPFMGKTNPNRKYQNSGFDFEPNKIKACDFANKIRDLVSGLENHRDELRSLETDCSVYINTYWNSYYGNSMLGGFYLDAEIIKKLSDLNLSIDFDLYTGGTPFKS